MRIIGSLVGLLFASSILCACSSGDDSGKILDIRNVVNKTPAQVAQLLGAPDTTYTERIMGKEIFCQRYYRNNIEIQYPESLSTDIVVYGPHGLPFTQSALRAFDLPFQKQHPSQYEKETLMRWYDFENFAAISFYNVQKDSAGRISNYTIFFKAKDL